MRERKWEEEEEGGTVEGLKGERDRQKEERDRQGKREGQGMSGREMRRLEVGDWGGEENSCGGKGVG